MVKVVTSKIIARGIAVSIAMAALSGCAHKAPKCDYGELVGTCSASVDPSGTALLLRAARCAQVEVRADDRTRVIRVDDGEYPIASAATNVEVVGCQTFKDNRPQ